MKRDEIEHALAVAESAAQQSLMDAIRAAGSGVGVRRAAHRNLRQAEARVGDCYRSLAESTGEEFAVPFDAGCEPEAAVSGAFVLEDEYKSFLFFNVSTSDPDVAEGTRAIVEVVGTLLTKFGLPNDEALPGHPLYNRGLRYYSIAEVLNSSWAREAEERNRISFPEALPWSARHFIFTFHDSSFECLARELKIELTQEQWPATIARIIGKFSEY
jgi:hypothetical protein